MSFASEPFSLVPPEAMTTEEDRSGLPPLKVEGREITIPAWLALIQKPWILTFPSVIIVFVTNDDRIG